MILIWSLVILAILFLVSCMGIVLQKRNVLIQANRSIDEKLWIRRNKLPLLVELCPDLPKNLKKEIIELRNYLSFSIDPLNVALAKEKRLSEMIKKVMLICADQEAKNSILVSLCEEMESDHKKLLISINDYNYELMKILNLFRFPWFGFWKFVIKSNILVQLSTI